MAHCEYCFLIFHYYRHSASAHVSTTYSQSRYEKYNFYLDVVESIKAIAHFIFIVFKISRAQIGQYDSNSFSVP